MNDYTRNKESGILAARGEKCVNCGNWIEPPAVAFVIADSQRYPACVCGNPCSQQQAFASIFGQPVTLAQYRRAQQGAS